MMVKKTDVAIVGYGNVGKGVYRAILKNPDMNLSGIVTRNPRRVSDELKQTGVDSYIQVVDARDKAMLLKFFDGSINMAILCGGSKNDLPEQGPYFAQLCNTVDSFDTHDRIPEYLQQMDESATKSGNISVISAGWDPGLFSLERVLANAFMPGAKAYGFYGLTETGGVSQGHSDAIRQIQGVKDARQYTHAKPETIQRVRDGENPVLKPGDMHQRECFVVLEEGISETEIRNKILNMPSYFEPYTTTVKFISQEEMDKTHSDMPHDGLVIASSETGNGNRTVIEYRNQWESNPEATANILIAYARAAHKLSKDGKTGALTILDIPPAYLSPHTRDVLIKNFM